jgi:hypothetical protein
MGGDHRSRVREHCGRCSILLAGQPELTLKEIRGALAVQHGITVGLTTLWRFPKKVKFTPLPKRRAVRLYHKAACSSAGRASLEVRTARETATASSCWTR